MAISTNTFDSLRVQTLAPGSSVAANPQPYENTHTILIYNRGANVVRLAIGTAGGAIAIGAGVEVPAGGAVTLAIGTNVNRAGGNFDAPSRILVVDSSGGAGDVVLTYLNAIGSA